MNRPDWIGIQELHLNTTGDIDAVSEQAQIKLYGTAMRIRSGMWVSILFVLLGLVGCGPMYSTEYRLTPPSTALGLQCAERCEDDQEYCEEYAREEKEYCEELNRREMDDCNERILREKKRAPKWTECGRQRFCSDDIKQCESDYRECYERCGGLVEQHQVCVMNCPEQ